MTEFEPRNAFEHIDKLAYEIGPRLAGTRGERAASEYIRGEFERYGLKTQVQEFRFVSRSAKLKATSVLFATVFIAVALLPPEFSIVAWLGALGLWRMLEKVMPKRSSQNIIATLKAQKPEKRVAVTAHYDSAPCLVNYKIHLVVKLMFSPLLAVNSIILILRCLELIPAWPVVWIGLALVFLPVCAGMFAGGYGRKVSPGANDNASGVAVTLEVARVLSESPPENTELKFIAFGAEEQGMIGAKNLASKKLLPPDTVVLNLDTVGVGSQAYIVEGNGILRKTRTSHLANRALAESIRQSGLEPKFMWAPVAGHDHIPLVRAGIHATTFSVDTAGQDKLGKRFAKLFMLPNAKIRGYRYIHTLEDVPDRLELKNVERAGNVALNFIKSQRSQLDM